MLNKLPLEPSASTRPIEPSDALQRLAPASASAPAFLRGLSVPVASLGELPARGVEREVFVYLAQAPLGARVFLESLPVGGPPQRIRALALPTQAGDERRVFRALLPVAGLAGHDLYAPIAVLNNEELRGAPFHARDSAAAVVSAPTPRSSNAANLQQPNAPLLPFPKMELLAHVEAELPRATVFGPTPDGVRIAFYLSDGHWRGPRIHARYRAEGGDWLIVRKDGVGIPNVRATLETSDGALLYYELTGSMDLGPGGYEAVMSGAMPEVAPFSAVAHVSTSSPSWAWLNRLTLVGAGVVNLKIRRAVYDLYSLQAAPEAMSLG